MDVTFPQEPTLTEPTLQEFLALEVPTKPTLQTPTFTATAPSAPASTVIFTLPFVYAAYANIIQDDIDDVVTDLESYTIPNTQTIAKWRVAKEELFRKFDKARREFLQNEGSRNLISLSGSTQKKLLDLSLTERRELSEAGLKLLADGVNFSTEQVDYALKSAVESDSIRFDSHHRLQTANFEAASYIIKAGIDAVSSDIDKYNQTVELISSELEQAKNETLLQLQLLEEFNMELQAASLQVEIDTFLMEAYKAGIEYVIAKAGIQLVRYRVYLIQAEILRQEAQLGVAESELALAKIQAVTAQYETYKAVGKTALAELDAFKQEIDAKKAEIELFKIEIGALREQLAVDIEHGNEQMQINNMRLQELREEIQNSIVEARIIIPESETSAAITLLQLITETIEGIIENIAAEAQTIGEARLASERVVTDAYRQAEIGMSLALEMSKSLNEFDRRDAMTRAAEAAADATVRSDYYHIEGD